METQVNNFELIQTFKHIRNKTATEIYCEKKSNLENIDTSFGILEIASQQLGSSSNFSTICTNNRLISNSALDCITQIADTISVVGPAVNAVCKIAYLSYEYLKHIEEESARVTYYNMLEWCRVRLQLKIPLQTHENTISSPLKFANKIGIVPDNFIDTKEIKNLENGSIENFKEAYYGITAFIFGNFINSIDQILISFLNDNKQSNVFVEAHIERTYAQEKFEQRKKELCYDKMINLFLYTAKHKEFPIDYVGELNSLQIQTINKFISEVPEKESVYVQGSIFCFLFKTLECAVNNLENNLYKITDNDRQKLMIYFREKNAQYFDSWHEYNNYTSLIKAHYFKINPYFQKDYMRILNDLCNLIEKKKQKVRTIESKNKINIQCTDSSEFLLEQTKSTKATTKDLEKIKVLQTYLEQNIQSFRDMQKIEGKRLICFTQNIAYDIFLNALKKDDAVNNLLYFVEHEEYEEVMSILYKPDFYFNFHGFKNEKIKYKNLITEKNVSVIEEEIIRCYDLSFRDSIAGRVFKHHFHNDFDPYSIIAFPLHLALTAVFSPVHIILDVSQEQTFKYVRMDFTPKVMTRAEKVIEKTNSFISRHSKDL